ncbi:chemotaxis protein CheY [Microbacterium sp. 10M-3C3]|jgi:4'-phosphopantetheinyl transferase|uniref:chemotaxis protein CheY n=1 Tax=Microbacterium sp. 10M-3C3 TaxID=2483401 RepID=UPI000F6412EF|nr:chemotaxis protein CheY [Microbacterium sp. 10M-3C3]
MLPGAEVVSVCSRCGGDHGRPVLRGGGPALSIAYAGGYAVVAVAAEASAVGIDAEPERSDDLNLDRVLRAGAGLRDWVRVEAVLKADGRALRIDPGAVRITEEEDRWCARFPRRAGSITGWDAAGPPGMLVSVAVIPRSPRE